MTGDAAWPEGYALKHLESVDSTNEEARRLAAAGEAGPVWIVADRQLAGRGRRGRSWLSQAGNLTTTLLIQPGRPAGQVAQLSFVAALAAHDVISAFATDVAVHVKWPNDILAGGKKICGILLETASRGVGPPEWLAIGFGLNLSFHPEKTEMPATSLAALTGKAAPAPGTVLVSLAASFAKWYEIWRIQGFAPIRDGWLSRAAGLGAAVRARLKDGERLGVFEDIDENGALILREAHGQMAIITAGEIFFG